MDWTVYILKCSDGSYYTGCTNDIVKRLDVHNSGRGAKYTRSRLPCEVVFSEEFESKSDAMKKEYLIKTWSRAEKQVLIDEQIKEQTCPE